MSDDTPAIDLALPQKLNGRSPPLTVFEKEAFVAALKTTRSQYAAAIAARPFVRDKKSAWEVFKRAIEKDAEFRAQVGQAMTEALGTFETELFRRVLEGIVEREEYHENGSLKMRVVKYDSKLLLAALSRLSQKIEPGAWDKTQRVIGEHHVTVTPELQLEDLTRDQRDLLLAKLREKRALAAKNGNVIDVEPAPREPLHTEGPFR